jgi:hypothetical protein
VLRANCSELLIDRDSGQLDELDVEGILAFAQRILSRASEQSSFALRATEDTILRVSVRSLLSESHPGEKMRLACPNSGIWNQVAVC